MCGIIGVVNSSGLIPIDRTANALDVLASRGPDDRGVWRDGDIILGHRRLSVMGGNCGYQPMVSPDGCVAVSCNGEFYDYEKIRIALSDEYEFTTNSDSEILIPLYLKYGIPGMLRWLRGEFAFMLYDKNQRTLYAVRDRFGIKPLCWWQNGAGDVIVASKSKAILEYGITARWDMRALSQALTLHYQPANRTFFEGISQVAPGCVLVCQRNKQPREYRYWELEYPREDFRGHVIGEAEAVARTRKLLKEAVQLRLRSDVPVCCHLSGGLDSSAVAGIMAAAVSKPVDCFTIEFPEIDKTYNEGEIARETVRQIGGVYHPVKVTQSDIMNNLSDAVYYSEGLAVNGHLSCKYLLNQYINKAGFKVALTGEGADECFAGYPHLRKDLYDSFPASERLNLIERLYCTNYAITGTEIAHGQSLDCSAISRRLGFVPSFIQAKAGIGFKMYGLLTSEVRDNLLSCDFPGSLIRELDPGNCLPSMHHINASLFLWCKTALCNYILATLGDGCEMSASVEGRLPFLDHHLFEFAASLPIDYKIKNGINEKYVLRQAVRSFVTDEVYSRQKHPFQAPPLTCVFTPEIIDRIYDELTSTGFLSMGIFDVGRLSHFVRMIPTMDKVDQTAIEPVAMLLLTINEMRKRFSL